MSMICDFIDISLELVDVVNGSHEPPTESEKRLAADISGQPPLDVVQQHPSTSTRAGAEFSKDTPRVHLTMMTTFSRIS